MAQLHTGLDLLSRGDALLCAPRGYVLIHANWWNPTRASIHYVDGHIIELHEPYTPADSTMKPSHFSDLILHGQRESPVIPTSFPSAWPPPRRGPPLPRRPFPRRRLSTPATPAPNSLKPANWADDEEADFAESLPLRAT